MKNNIKNTLKGLVAKICSKTSKRRNKKVDARKYEVSTLERAEVSPFVHFHLFWDDGKATEEAIACALDSVDAVKQHVVFAVEKYGSKRRLLRRIYNDESIREKMGRSTGFSHHGFELLNESVLELQLAILPAILGKSFNSMVLSGVKLEESKKRVKERFELFCYLRNIHIPCTRNFRMDIFVCCPHGCSFEKAESIIRSREDFGIFFERGWADFVNETDLEHIFKNF